MLAHLLLALAALAGGRPAPGDHIRSLRIAGLERRYLMHMPRPARRGRLPVVVMLHAAGSSGRRLAASTRFSAEADRRGFVALYPDGADESWSDGRDAAGPDDVGFIRAMLDTVAAEVRGDPRRVYAAGISNGAMFVHRLACELPGRFAAIAAVAGGVPTSVAARCAGTPPVSLIAFNGTEDRYVPYEGGGGLLSAVESVSLWAAAAHCGAPPVPVSLRDPVPADSTRIRRQTWQHCQAGLGVTLYTIVGGGHSWPGGDATRLTTYGRTTRDVSATRAIAAFFAMHARGGE